MKRIVSIIALACLFATNLAAQSSTGGIYFKCSLTSQPLSSDNEEYWATCPTNPKFRDLYIQKGTDFGLHVLNSKGEDITKDCSLSSSSQNAVVINKKTPRYRVADHSKWSADWDKPDGSLILEGYDYKGHNVATGELSSDTPKIITAKYGDKECSIRVFVYSDRYKKEGDNCYRKAVPVKFKKGKVVCEVKNLKKEWGMEIEPKWSLVQNGDRYCLKQEQFSPGSTYELYYYCEELVIRNSMDKTETVQANDLKPGDFVVWNATKSRYEAIDGGWRSKKSNLGKDASSFKNQVIGIVATVYKDTPYGTSGLKGIYTSDGKMYHALVVDLQDCDKTWEYSSDNDDPAAGNDIWGHGLRRGYTLTKFFLPYNDRRGASHRIKPIYWIASRNSAKPLQGGTTGWYLPSVYEMEHANLQAVNASLHGLIKAGRTDVGKIRVGSDYWTCEYDRNHNDKAYAWTFIDEPNNHKVKTYVRKKQATLFVRAVFSL